MIFTLLSLGTFTFGALAFSVLAATYWLERLRGHARAGGVFPVFTLVCALAFALNLLWRSWLLDAVTGLIPMLLFHLVYEEEQLRPRWLPLLFYLALPAAFAENGPTALLGSASLGGLVAQVLSRRKLTDAERRHRWSIRVLLILTGATAVGSYFQFAPWITLLPDYLVLAFLAVTLYYKERLTFFDLILKRGAFFAAGLIALSGFFAFSPWPVWLNALLLTPLWVAAPWVYDRISQMIDRLWLRRPYGRVAAERHFVHAVQSADTTEVLDARATQALGEIFQTTATVKGAEITLAPRPDGVPFLSDDQALLQSLSRTLEVVRENVSFRQREQELRMLAGRAELKALRAQINPHFLFNALNAIAGLIHTQPELAEETVERLAEVFRYTLRKSEKEWVRLDEEMEFVTACLGVEKARFGERLATEIEIDPAAVAIHVPAMCLQTLVENAVKHGTSQVQGQGRIAIRASIEGAWLMIRVTDNGPGFPAGFQLRGASGHGLRNVAERLAGYYGDSARLKWENLPEGVCVSMELPCAS
jgi:signal transduction histidine kinase